MDTDDTRRCPSCGGSGGGPFGPAGSAWDTEDYICPRCAGLGIVAIRDDGAVEALVPASGRPGLAKPGAPPPAPAQKKRAAGDA